MLTWKSWLQRTVLWDECTEQRTFKNWPQRTYNWNELKSDLEPCSKILKEYFGWDGGLLVVPFTRLVNLRDNHGNVHKLATHFVKYFMMKNNHSYFINIKSRTKDSFIQSLRISLLFNERKIKHFHLLYQYNSSTVNYKSLETYDEDANLL